MLLAAQVYVLSHLDEFLRDPTSSRRGIFDSVTKLINVLAAGEAPVAHAPWIASAPLTPLAKKDMTTRPIAVGETLRRLVSNCLLSKSYRKAAVYIPPYRVTSCWHRDECQGRLQCSWHPKNGESCRKNPEFSLLSVDLKNAFNLCSRSAFLKGTESHFRRLLRWVLYSYNDPASLWTGFDILLSVSGTQQGNPFGCLLSDLVLQKLISRLQDVLSLSEGDVEARNVFLQLWYHDDGYTTHS